MFSTQQAGQVNGMGEAILAGSQSVLWSWTALTSTEVAWIATTLLAGETSLTLTAAELWTDTFAEQAFTSGVVYRPIFGVRKAGLFWDVQLEIRHLLPLILS